MKRIENLHTQQKAREEVARKASAYREKVRERSQHMYHEQFAKSQCPLSMSKQALSMSKQHRKPRPLQILRGGCSVQEEANSTKGCREARTRRTR